MARIRSVHPGLFTDETFMELSPHAQIFTIGLWTEADDQGVFPWKPKTLKARLLPAASVDAGELLAQLLDGGVLGRFEVDGQSYGVIRNFRRFQRPEKPKAVHPLPEKWREFVGLSSNSHTCSRKPQPPIGDGAPSGPGPADDLPPMSGGAVEDVEPTDHRPVGDQSATSRRFAGPMEEEGGRREEEEKPPSLPSEAQAPLAAQQRGSRLPDGWAPDPGLRAFADGLGLEPGRVAEQFRDYWRAKAGKDARKADWAATWRTWCRREADSAPGRQPRPATASRAGQADLSWMEEPGAVESLLQ
jgi:hypothetical protein